MDYAEFIETITEQSAAIRAVAVEAGPDADIATCTKWDVHALVQHLARVQGWAATAVADADAGTQPPRPEGPADFAELLPWWDEQLATLVDGLRAHEPADPAWAFGPNTPRSMLFWARRQAHEAAIHRLDVESALSDPPVTHFAPAFAADGIDEMLTWIAPLDQRWPEATLTGSVLYHAADAGRAWLVTFAPGAVPTITDAAAALGGGLTSDATVAGTADAVYRAVWGRPSTAVRSGDAELGGAIHGR